MGTVQKDGYTLEVDFEKNRAYYQSHPLCRCASCENFYAQIKGRFPKLEAFLDDLGIDISRPDEIMSLDYDDKVEYIGVDYTVCGKVPVMGQDEIEIQDTLAFHLGITNGFVSPNTQTSDYFTVSIRDIIELPWAQEPSFSEKSKALEANIQGGPEMNSFKTRSTSAKSVRTTVFTFIPMFALAFLGLKVAIATWLFLEAVLLLTFGFCLLLTAKTHWEIEFQEDRVLLYNTGNKQSYVFEELKQSDFHIRQTEKQKVKNACDMRLEDSVFRFYDVQSCQEMQAYIQEHFPQ